MNFKDLRDWALKDIIGASDMQGITDRLNAMWPFTVSGALRMYRGAKGGMHLHVEYVPPQPPEIRRVTVTTVPDQTTNPSIMLVKDWDGTTATGSEFPVKALCLMAVDDELIVLRVTNGLAPRTYTGPSMGATAEPVLWIDRRPPGTYRAVLASAAGSGSSVPPDWTYGATLEGFATTINASPLTPLYRPSPGWVPTAAGKGELYIDDDGVPKDLIAFETVSSVRCTTPP